MLKAGLYYYTLSLKLRTLIPPGFRTFYLARKLVLVQMDGLVISIDLSRLSTFISILFRRLLVLKDSLF